MKYQITYSTENTPDFSSLNTTAISKRYHIPSIGFQMLLPEGWSGVDNQNIAMVSPAGMNLKTGALEHNGDKVMMVIQHFNIHDFAGGMKEYRQGYEKSGCKILSDKFVKVNKINSEELFKQCGSRDGEKVINYIFASANAIIFVSLKGAGIEFDNNLNEFRDSITTIKISNPIDIRQLNGFNSN